jgi:hypothetical protein
MRNMGVDEEDEEVRERIRTATFDVH